MRGSWLNHGEEVDPSDLPSFVSWLRLRLDVTTARTLYDLDLPIRGRRLAELLGAGSLVDTVEAITADPTEILVQRNPTAPVPPAPSATDNEPEDMTDAETEN